MTGWRATNSPATAVMASEFCRDIRGRTGSMHFPAPYPSAPREQSSLCLWFTGPRSPGSQRLFHSKPGHFPTRTSSSTTLLTVSLRLHLPAEMTNGAAFTTCYRSLLPVATNFKDKLFQPLSNTLSGQILCAIPTSKGQPPNLALASWEVLASNYLSS